MRAEKNFFGVTKLGESVYNYTLTNNNGMSVTISEFGGAIVNLFVPDRNGKLADIVCGYDDLLSYEESDGYQGALIGRWGNRIKAGKFTLDGVEYSLYCNNGNNHLHGGKVGFSNKVWTSNLVEGADATSLILEYFSPDMEEGYPGNLKVKVTYTLDNDNTLTIDYFATTDKLTVISLTNHSYFNLAGFNSGKVFDHILKLECDRFIPTDGELIPTGEIKSVDGGAFDFREEKTIGRDFSFEDENIALAKGYDHCFVFTDGLTVNDEKITVKEPISGRKMTVYTDQPAVQFYSGNFLTDNGYPFKGGYVKNLQCAFCLETELMPDSMNHENFTKCTLAPDEEYKTVTKFKFEWN